MRGQLSKDSCEEARHRIYCREGICCGVPRVSFGSAEKCRTPEFLIEKFSTFIAQIFKVGGSLQTPDKFCVSQTAATVHAAMLRLMRIALNHGASWTVYVSLFVFCSAFTNFHVRTCNSNFLELESLLVRAGRNDSTKEYDMAIGAATGPKDRL